MNNLPKLLKPYYSIEQTFNRLNLAGANLDEAEDVLSLARQGMIEVSLLCDEQLILVPKDQVDKKIAELGGDIPELCCEWAARNEIKLQPLVRLGDGITPDGFYYVDNQDELLVTLIDSPDARVDDMYATAWLKPSITKTLSLPVTLIVNDDTYYVCDNLNCDPFSTLMDKNELPDRFGIGGLERLIQKGNYVVTKEEILSFEEEAGGTSKNNIKGVQIDASLLPREIEIALEAHAAININDEGNKYQSPSKRIEAWLSNNYPQESDAFYKRIKTSAMYKEEDKSKTD